MSPAATHADRLTWIGHATVVLDLGATRLMTDPVLRARVLQLRRHGRMPDPALLRDVDAVLISHLHLDHLDLPSLRLLRPPPLLVVPRGAGAFLRRAGFADVREVAAGDDLPIGDVRVAAVPAQHGGARRPGGPVAPPLGYVIAAAGVTIYFAGDTALFDGMASIGARGLDVALLPIWGWGPTLGPGHMDPAEAARATAVLRPAVVVPIHWGTLYPRGLAGVLGASLADPPARFAAEVARQAPSVAVRVLRTGGALPLRRGPLAGDLRTAG